MSDKHGQSVMLERCLVGVGLVVLILSSGVTYGWTALENVMVCIILGVFICFLLASWTFPR